MNNVLRLVVIFCQEKKGDADSWPLHKWLKRESMSSGNGVVMSNNIMECSLDH